MDGMYLYRNIRKCDACGGNCCKIYLRASDGGAMPEDAWFEEWCSEFHMNEKNYGVKPLFNPLVVHLMGNEYMVKELESLGIDSYSCQYLGKRGCRIPWDKRPLICRSWKCEKLDDSDIVGIVRFSKISPISDDKVGAIVKD